MPLILNIYPAGSTLLLIVNDRVFAKIVHYPEHFSLVSIGAVVRFEADELFLEQINHTVGE